MTGIPVGLAAGAEVIGGERWVSVDILAARGRLSKAHQGTSEDICGQFRLTGSNFGPYRDVWTLERDSRLLWQGLGNGPALPVRRVAGGSGVLAYADELHAWRVSSRGRMGESTFVACEGRCGDGILVVWG
jgi:hypothetical protein